MWDNSSGPHAFHFWSGNRLWFCTAVGINSLSSWTKCQLSKGGNCPVTFLLPLWFQHSALYSESAQIWAWEILWLQFYIFAKIYFPWVVFFQNTALWNLFSCPRVAFLHKEIISFHLCLINSPFQEFSPLLADSFPLLSVCSCSQLRGWVDMLMRAWCVGRAPPIFPGLARQPVPT